jgi:uncharacterized membrane protein
MKFGGKLCGLVFLFIAGLMPILSASTALAQMGSTDLILTFQPDNYYNKVTAGEDNRFFLELRNNGSLAISNITLSSDKPEGWTIEFRPEKIDYLGSHSVQTADVTIKPPADIAKGEYTVTFIAEATGIRKALSTRLEVESGKSFWPWVGAIVAVVVVVGFIIVFMRFGRNSSESES